LLIVVTAVAAAAVVSAVAIFAASSEPPRTAVDVSPRPLASAPCKPGAALGLEFEIVETRGERVEVEYGIHPRLSMRDVTWELVLHGSVSLVEGTRSGRVDGGASSGRLTLHVPGDGLYKTAELVVRGIAPGSSPDGGRFDEPVATAAMLEWERPEAFLPRVARRDALTGQVELAERVPSNWTPAPSAAADVGAAEGGADGSAADGSTAESGAAAAGFLVTGTFLYEDKAWYWKGWTGEDPLQPVRRADVTVFDNATLDVLGVGSTGQDGSFTVRCEASGPVDLAVMCETDTSHDESFQRMRVVPHSNIDYLVQGPVFPGHDGLSDLDVGTVTALKVVLGGKEGNPFNVFDMSVYAWEFLLGTLHTGFTPNKYQYDPPAIRNIWPSGTTSKALTWGIWLDIDDGYDDVVILHELAHVAHFQYGKITTGGGAHWFGDSDQDPRTSFTEGFATFFAGMVLDHMGRRPMFMNCWGSVQVGGVSLRAQLETKVPYALDSRGVADELAVCAALFDMMDDVDTIDATPGEDDDPFDGGLLENGQTPLEAFWELFTGPIARTFQETHNDTWDTWVERHGDGPETEALRDLFAAHGQYFMTDAHEPDGSAEQAVLLPLAQDQASWSGPFTQFSPRRDQLAPKDLDEDWFAHELVKGSVVTFETRYPGGIGDADTQADPRMELYGPDRSLVAWDEDSGTGRNARIADFVVPETGTWRVRVFVQDDGWWAVFGTWIRRYGRYEYRALASLENHLPVLTQAPVAQPATVQVGERVQLTAEAADEDEGQALVYTWRPLDGGTIHGTGASVAFVPPAVSEATTVRVQLVVFDDLGAESEAQVVEVMVQPAAGAWGLSAL
jgi:hypothetical protein